VLDRNLKDFLEKNVSSYYDVTQPSMIKKLEQGKLKVLDPNSPDEYCNTITTKQVRYPNSGVIDKGDGKYRYLTEKECFRLMGFDGEDYEYFLVAS